MYDRYHTTDQAEPAELHKGDRCEYLNRKTHAWEPGTVSADAFEHRGYRCYTVTLDSGDSRWGYDDQFRPAPAA